MRLMASPGFDRWASKVRFVTATKENAGSGGDREDRTPDLLIANQTLSQLSYAPILNGTLQT